MATCEAHAFTRCHFGGAQGREIPRLLARYCFFGLVKEISAAHGAGERGAATDFEQSRRGPPDQVRAEQVLKKLPEVRQVMVDVRQPAGGPSAAGGGQAGQTKCRA